MVAPENGDGSLLVWDGWNAARPFAFPTEGAHMRPIETEDADLVVHGVRDEDGLIGAEGDGADPAELVGSLPFGHRFGSDRDDRGEEPFGWRTGISDVDGAAYGVECRGEVTTARGGVALIAGCCQGGREEEWNLGSGDTKKMRGRGHFWLDRVGRRHPQRCACAPVPVRSVASGGGGQRGGRRRSRRSPGRGKLHRRAPRLAAPPLPYREHPGQQLSHAPTLPHSRRRSTRWPDE